MKVAYSKEGQWYDLSPEAEDLFFIFCPFGNTIYMIINLLDSPYEKKYYKTSFLDELTERLLK